MTSSVILSIVDHMRIFTIQWDIHTLSIMMLSLIFVQVLQQKFIFHL